eukprot:jgi/Bigna1/138213/aug1.43_g12921
MVSISSLVFLSAASARLVRNESTEQSIMQKNATTSDLGSLVQISPSSQHTKLHSLPVVMMDLTGSGESEVQGTAAKEQLSGNVGPRLDMAPEDVLLLSLHDNSLPALERESPAAGIQSHRKHLKEGVVFEGGLRPEIAEESDAATDERYEDNQEEEEGGGGGGGGGGRGERKDNSTDRFQERDYDDEIADKRDDHGSSYIPSSHHNHYNHHQSHHPNYRWYETEEEGEGQIEGGWNADEGKNQELDRGGDFDQIRNEGFGRHGKHSDRERGLGNNNFGGAYGAGDGSIPTEQGPSAFSRHSSSRSSDEVGGAYAEERTSEHTRWLAPRFARSNTKESKIAGGYRAPTHNNDGDDGYGNNKKNVRNTEVNNVAKREKSSSSSSRNTTASSRATARVLQQFLERGSARLWLIFMVSLILSFSVCVLMAPSPPLLTTTEKAEHEPEKDSSRSGAATVSYWWGRGGKFVGGKSEEGQSASSPLLQDEQDDELPQQQQQQQQQQPKERQTTQGTQTESEAYFPSLPTGGTAGGGRGGRGTRGSGGSSTLLPRSSFTGCLGSMRSYLFGLRNSLISARSIVASESQTKDVIDDKEIERKITDAAASCPTNSKLGITKKNVLGEYCGVLPSEKKLEDGGGVAVPVAAGDFVNGEEYKSIGVGINGDDDDEEEEEEEEEEEQETRNNM